MNKRLLKHTLFLLILALVQSCGVIPDYQKPPSHDILPKQYHHSKEPLWKISQPGGGVELDEKWWEIYHDPQLDNLQEQLLINNQDIISNKAQYQEALFALDKARAGYFPTINLNAALTNGKQTAQAASSYARSVGLDASWQANLFNSIGYNVNSAAASAEGFKNQLDLTILSVQTTLAQNYYEYCMVAKNQRLLDSIAGANKELFDYTSARYSQGLEDQAKLDQATINQKNASALAINNKIDLDSYKNAILLLINSNDFSVVGECTSLPKNSIDIAIGISSELLERRADIAKAERNVAMTNAQMGINSVAYFPSLTLTISETFQAAGLKHFLSLPNQIWSLGPQLAYTLFDGGARVADYNTAEQKYQAAIADYKKTVLGAFYDVENNLSSAHHLDQQLEAIKEASQKSRNIFKVVNNKYLQGIIDNSEVLNAKIDMLKADKNGNDINGLRISAEIALIKSIGGGWRQSEE